MDGIVITHDFTISNGRTPNDRVGTHNIAMHDNKETAALELGLKTSKFQTMVEVLKCDFGKPLKPSSATGGAEHVNHWTPLYHAVYFKREAALLHFLRAGQMPDGKPDTQPPLCIAVAAGHANITRILCEAGANIDVRSIQSGETPLHLAVKAGRDDILDILLEYKPNLDARTMYTHDTPLHYAATRGGSTYGVSALLTHGANFEAVNDKGRSPAHVALQNQNMETAITIIRVAGKSPRKLGREKQLLLNQALELHSRGSIGNVLFAQALEVACPPDSTGLVEAIKTKNANVVIAVIARGANPNEQTPSGLYPIFAALGAGSARVVQTLIDHKADVTLRNSHGLNVLQAALESPFHDKDVITKVFELLLAHGADPCVKYTDGTTLLHYAVKPSFELVKIAQILLQNGVRVDAQDSNGDTALHVAATSPPCVTMLLKHGANPDLVNSKVLTPLLCALSSSTGDREPDLQELLKVSDLRRTTKFGKMPLHLAAQNGLAKTVKLLLSLGADTNSIDRRKCTPLLLAATRQQWAVVPLLASHPGTNSWDENGLTALHHIAMSTPKNPSTWKHIAMAAAPFCEKGVSRSLRDQSGSTPLIQAVKTLPNDGLPVVEVLLSRRGSERGNCVAHEDHDQHDALYYAVTLGKVAFVETLLVHGTPFSWNEWKQQKNLIPKDSAVNKKIWKLFAEHEWLKRLVRLRRYSGILFEDSLLPKIIPIQDLGDMLCMGLGPDTVPRAKHMRSLLWTLLETGLSSSVIHTDYLCDALTLMMASGANPNVMLSRKTRCAPDSCQPPPAPLAVHPLTYMLEKCPQVNLDLLTLLLDSGAMPSISSPFYEGRYPLHSAVRANRIDVVEELLRRKADIEAKDSAGRTPLHTAVAVGNASIVSWLLRNGAKADSTDQKDLTPIRCFSANLPENEKQHIAKLLQGATQDEPDRISQLLSPYTDLSDDRGFKMERPSSTASRTAPSQRPPPTPPPTCPSPRPILKFSPFRPNTPPTSPPKKKDRNPWDTPPPISPISPIIKDKTKTTPPSHNKPKPRVTFKITPPDPEPESEPEPEPESEPEPAPAPVPPPSPPTKSPTTPATPSPTVSEIEPSEEAERSDSGFGFHKAGTTEVAALRDGKRGSGPGDGEVVEGEELRGWLDYSRMMDRL